MTCSTGLETSASNDSAAGGPSTSKVSHQSRRATRSTSLRPTRSPSLTIPSSFWSAPSTGTALMRFSSSRRATSRTLVPIVTETIAVVMRSPAVSRVGATANGSSLALDDWRIMRPSPPRDGRPACTAPTTRSDLPRRSDRLHAAANMRVGASAAAGKDTPPADRGLGKTNPTSLQTTEALPSAADSESTQPLVGRRGRIQAKTRPDIKAARATASCAAPATSFVEPAILFLSVAALSVCFVATRDCGWNCAGLVSPRDRSGGVRATAASEMAWLDEPFSSAWRHAARLRSGARQGDQSSLRPRRLKAPAPVGSPARRGGATSGRRSSRFALRPRARLAPAAWRNRRPALYCPAQRRRANRNRLHLNGRRDAGLGDSDRAAMVNASEFPGADADADRRARDGQPYEVDGNLLHRIPPARSRQPWTCGRQREEASEVAAAATATSDSDSTHLDSPAEVARGSASASTAEADAGGISSFRTYRSRGVAAYSGPLERFSPHQKRGVRLQSLAAAGPPSPPPALSVRPRPGDRRFSQERGIAPCRYPS